MKIIFSICICIFIYTFTYSSIFNSDIFLGNWNAVWSIPNKGFVSFPSAKSNIMLGYFSFEKNGTVYIQGFGNPDCLFSSDTISYNANWSIHNNKLIVGHNRLNQFEYKISSIKKDKIELILLDDISLVLRK